MNFCKHWGPWAFFLSLTLASSIFCSASEANVVAYIPSLSSARVIQRNIQKQLPNFKVSVFAKYRDFSSYIKENKPEYIIGGLGPDNLVDYAPLETPMKLAKEKKKYFLIALDKKWQGASLNKARVGSVEFLDKESIGKSLKENFLIDPKVLRTVAKPVDLFPLLVFNSVDVILVEELMYEKLKTRFSTTTYVVKRASMNSITRFYVNKTRKNPKLDESVIRLDYESLNDEEKGGRG